MSYEEKTDHVALVSYSRFATFEDLRNVLEELRRVKEDTQTIKRNQAKLQQSYERIMKQLGERVNYSLIDGQESKLCQKSKKIEQGCSNKTNGKSREEVTNGVKRKILLEVISLLIESLDVVEEKFYLEPFKKSDCP